MGIVRERREHSLLTRDIKNTMRTVRSPDGFWCWSSLVEQLVLWLVHAVAEVVRATVRVLSPRIEKEYRFKSNMRQI